MIDPIEAIALGLPQGVMYQRTADGQIKPIEGIPKQEIPTTKEFPDGTMRQYDPASGAWKTIARKPAGEGKTMYEGKPTVDANGNLVFLPNRPGLPVVDATTGKPINYEPSVPVKIFLLQF